MDSGPLLVILTASCGVVLAAVVLFRYRISIWKLRPCMTRWPDHSHGALLSQSSTKVQLDAIGASCTCAEPKTAATVAKAAESKVQLPTPPLSRLKPVSAPPKARVPMTSKRRPEMIIDVFSADKYMEEKKGLSPYVLPVYHQHVHRTILNATSELLMHVKLTPTSIDPAQLPPPPHYQMHHEKKDDFSEIALDPSKSASASPAVARDASFFSPNLHYLTWWYLVPKKKKPSAMITPLSTLPRSIGIKRRDHPRLSVTSDAHGSMATITPSLSMLGMAKTRMEFDNDKQRKKVKLELGLYR
ncbi:hypothetical protein BC940DRAFT_328555 [Gongronella butleri]|nr:hypothetical protein BC940DRAFT_328555 [Gongronella butleri]